MRTSVEEPAVAAPSRAKEIEDELKGDPRWELIERITNSASFQKSARIRDLLRYIAERSLRGCAKDLTEHRIGSVVFGKLEDYSVVEDSSVRVHVRQLRLRLHEYFQGEGRREALVVEIPKGAYTTLFHPAEQPEAAPALQLMPAVPRRKKWPTVLPWSLAILFFLCAVAGWWRSSKLVVAALPPWPLSEVLSTSQPVHVVVADINYGIMRLIEEKPGSLAEYLSPSFQQGFAPHLPAPREARLMKYLSSSLLTSYADLVVVDTLANLSGEARVHLSVRSAREMRPRDMEEGNYVFVGSPGSNPWVSFFENRLNFQEREGTVGNSLKYFQNLHPLAGEQPTYQGLEFTGDTGEDYATISLLPLSTGRGNVLIFQGLQQEGTEAAGLFLANPENRQQLKDALGIRGSSDKPVYFEALIRTRAVAGAPNTSSLVATRIIHP